MNKIKIRKAGRDIFTIIGVSAYAVFVSTSLSMMPNFDMMLIPVKPWWLVSLVVCLGWLMAFWAMQHRHPHTHLK
ncbi:MAG: hypothetical protein IJ184_02655 [Alphaproteobacteria bacterium]|nr:hypothetical protein [Alphaproteobacteria bacterium]